MKRTLLFILCAVILSVTMCPDILAASVNSSATYPTTVLRPPMPVWNDSAVLWLVVGQKNNTCVPLYNARISVKQVSNNVCVRAPCPQRFVMWLNYTETAVALPLACVDGTTPYGPQFNTGKLAVGEYTVLDSTKNNDTVLVFSVYENAPVYSLKGTVYQENPLLTISVPLQNSLVCLTKTSSTGIAYASSDSLHFIDSVRTSSSGKYTFANVTSGLYMINVSHAGFVSKSVLCTIPKDTLFDISLKQSPTEFSNAETTTVAEVSFVASTNKDHYVMGDSIKVRYVVKNNSMAKVSYDFSSGCKYDLLATDQKKDTVYWYMKNRACTTIMTQITLESGESVSIDFPAFVYTGNDSVLTISAQMIGNKYTGSAATIKVPVAKSALSSAFTKTNTTIKNASLLYSPATKTLSIIIPKSQNVSVSAYILNGQQISQLSCKKFLTAGTHIISLKKTALITGVVVFRIDGEGFSAVKRINVTESK